MRKQSPEFAHCDIDREMWASPRYLRGGSEYLRIGQNVTFSYFSRFTGEMETTSGKVIGLDWHAGQYVVEAEGKRWTVQKGTNGWKSPDNG